jgi:hypothetical protein
MSVVKNTLQQNESNVAKSVLRHPYIRALEQPIDRPRVSSVYLFMMALVAMLMILLPVIYAGLNEIKQQ